MITKMLDSLLIKVILLFMLIASGLAASEYPDKVIIDATKNCLECHDDMAASLTGSTHQLSDEKSGNRIVVGCINCHDGWANHIDDPSAENISNPKDLSFSGQAETCRTCHLTLHQSSMNSTNPHGLNGVKCLDCHKIHNNHNETLLAENRHEFCLSCHADVAAEFKRRSAHPYETGTVDCVDCHSMGEMTWADHSIELNWTCQNCHSEYAGPFIHEHPVTSKFPTEGSGCVECHQPHGSSNERLLNQPGDGLCRQCHGVPRHMTAHNGAFAAVACLDCHTDIHGSYEDSNFLDPMMGSNFGDGPNGCYCHTGAK